MDEFNYYSDDDAYDEAAVYAANVRDEEQRDIYYRELELQERREAYEEEFREARERSRDETKYLHQYSIMKYGTLKKALEARERNGFGPAILCARDVPKRNDNKMRIDFKKQYLIGRPRNLFSYAESVNMKVQLDEVMEANSPSPIHFDVEMKVSDNLASSVEDIAGVLIGVCKAYRPGEYDSVFDKATRLCEHYSDVSHCPFTEEVCRAGLCVMKESIEDSLVGMDKIDKAQLGMHVLSGCRADKFSLHIVMKEVYCESPVLSMALIVFEIARRFSLVNLFWLLDNENEWSSPVGVFRTRALMIKEMGHWEQTEGDDKKFTFSGYNDTPFDEAIYSKNHLLRAPGACKVSGWVGGLHPIIDDGSEMMRKEFAFRSIFGGNNGYECWKKHLIQQRDETTCTHVISGFEPTDSYPSKFRFFSNKATFGNAAKEGLHVCFGNVHCPSIVTPNDAMRALLGFVFEEKRLTYKKHRQMTLVERGIISRDVDVVPRQSVLPDECFRAESGKMKPFRLFGPDEFLYHVHNGVEEKTCSAKVFPGGFHCFGCNETFAIPKKDSDEECYAFFDDETQEETDANARLKTFDWKSILKETHFKKKWHVISAPMGSGKTHQMMGLVNAAATSNLSVCCVSFRVFLATQQAERLGLSNYKNCHDIKINPPDYLVIVVNSLIKLPPKKYDIIILDECGYIRRHFMSKTLKKVLYPVWQRFVSLIRDAGTVVMLQDGISRDDVQFYTDIDGVDCDDRSKVLSTLFKKPRVIHPIKYTDSFESAFYMMVTCYCASFKYVDGSVQCTQPFIVFCSSLSIAEFIVTVLKETAKSNGWDHKRIHGIWSSVKEETEFACKFAMDPNACAKEADVVVCTSVVGAGFSITHHFGSFHAFLDLNILTHTEETQFIQRLRFVMDELRPDAERQCYMYMAKGRGARYEYTDVLESYDVVRKLLYKQGQQIHEMHCPVSNLEATHARVVTEAQNTLARHVELWEKYAEFLESEFEKYSVEESKYIWVRVRLKTYKLLKVKCIADMVRIQCQNCLSQGIDIAETISQLDRAGDMEIYRLYANANVKGQVTQLEQAFASKTIASKLFEKMFEREEREKIVAKKNRLSGYIKRLRSLTMWMLYSYKGLLPGDKRENYFDHMDHQNSYNTDALKHCAHFILAHNLLPMLFSIASETKIAYVVDYATMPFYVGASVNAKDPSIGSFLEKQFEEDEHDDDVSKKKKKKMRACVKAMCGYHSQCQQEFFHLYNTEGKAHLFIKLLLKKIGLDLKNTNSRIPGANGIRKTTIESPSREFTFIWGLKKFGNSAKDILTMIMPTTNIDTEDKEWLEKSVSDFNDVCSEAGELGSIFVRHEPEFPLDACIRQRVHEERIKTALTSNTLEAADAPTNRTSEFRAASTLRRLRDRANRIEANFDSNLHNRYLEQAMNEVVNEEGNDTDIESDIDIEERPMIQNIFIQHEAEERP